MKYLLLFVAVMSFQVSWGAGKAPNKVLIRQLADQYFTQKQIAAFRSRSSVTINGTTVAGNCIPDQGPTSPKDCISMLCSKVSKYDCDDSSEISTIAGYCKGNPNGDCVNSVCAKVSKYDCDDVSEVGQVAGFCKGQYNAKCVDFACQQMGKYDCDDMSELEELLTKACTPGVDGDCVKSVCAKLSKYDCDDFSEIQTVAASCTP